MFYGSSPQDTVPVTANSVTSGIDVALTITPSIVGTVTAASDGQPISDAVVYAYASGSNFGDVVGITSTGPDGGYMLTNLPDGNYDIVFIDCGDAYPYSSASVCQYAPEVYTGNIGGTPWARDDSPSITLIAVNGGQVAQNVNAALYAVTSPWLVCPPDNAGACELSPATAGMTVTGSALPDPDADLPGAVLNPSVIPGGSLQFVPTDLSGGQFTNSQLPWLSFDTSTGILTVSGNENPGSFAFTLVYLSPSGQEAFAYVSLNVDWNQVSGQVSGPAVVNQSSTASYTVTAGPPTSTVNGPALVASGVTLAALHTTTAPGKIENGKVVVTDGKHIVCTELIKNDKTRCLIRGSRLGRGHQRLKFTLTASDSIHPRVISKVVNVKK